MDLGLAGNDKLSARFHNTLQFVGTYQLQQLVSTRTYLNRDRVELAKFVFHSNFTVIAECQAGDL